MVAGRVQFPRLESQHLRDVDSLRYGQLLTGGGDQRRTSLLPNMTVLERLFLEGIMHMMGH